VFLGWKACSDFGNFFLINWLHFLWRRSLSQAQLKATENPPFASDFWIPNEPCQFDRKKPPPRGVFLFTMFPTRTVCKRTLLEVPGTNSSRGVLLHTVLWWGNIVNRKPGVFFFDQIDDLVFQPHWETVPILALKIAWSPYFLPHWIPSTSSCSLWRATDALQGHDKNGCAQSKFHHVLHSTWPISEYDE